MTSSRTTPVRTCVGCRSTEAKHELLRVVRTPDGHVDVDPSGKANGRGAYVCARVECFDAAVSRRRFDHALRVRLLTDDVDRLRRDIETLLASGRPSARGR